MSQSKDQQVRDVVIGLALGVLSHGVEAVISGKSALESAFNRSWRRWSQSDQFPSIAGSNPGNLIWIGMGKSEGRRLACAAWSEGTWSRPYIRNDGWSVDDALDHHSTRVVTSEDWTELGRLFVGSLREEDVLRG